MSVATNIFDRDLESINEMEGIQKVEDFHGLKVITAHSDSLLCQIRVKFGRGAHHDTIPGSHHAIEHMMFRGRNKALVEQMEFLGANMNAYTSKTSVLFVISCVNDVARDVLHLASEMFNAKEFSIDSAQWEVEKTTIHSERTGYETSQNSIYWDTLTSIMSGDWRTILGGKDDIDSLTPEILMSDYDDMMSRHNTTVAITCDMVQLRYNITEFLQKLVAYLPVRGKSTMDLISMPMSIDKDTEHVVTNPYVNSNELGMAYIFDIEPGNVHFDAILTMLTIYLGGGLSSPVMKRLREQYGYVYETHAFIGRGTGQTSLLFNVNIDGQPVDKYKTEVDNIVAELTTSGLSEDEFAKMINRTKYILGSRMSNSEDSITSILYWLDVNSDIVYPTSVYMDIARHITLGEFNSVIQSLFTDHVQAKVVMSLLPETK